MIGNVLVLGILHVSVLYSGGGVNAACSTTQAAERSTHAVEMQFYRTQVDAWNRGDNSAKVAVQISNQANSYCASNPSACGLSTCCTGTEFKEIDVAVASGYPKADGKDLLLKMYLDVAAGLATNGDLQCVVSNTALRSIIERARQGVYDNTGIWITYADDVFFGIPSDNEMNAIIIPIACVVLLGVILTAIILHFWNKRREAMVRRQRKIEERKKTKGTKVSPAYDVGEKPSKTQPKKPSEREQAAALQTVHPAQQTKDQLYRDQMLMKKQQETAAKKNASVHSDDSAIRMEPEPPRVSHKDAYEMEKRQPQNDQGMGATPHTRLEPLQTWESRPEGAESEPKEKKKKKKSKKHKKTKDSESYVTVSETGDGTDY